MGNSAGLPGGTRWALPARSWRNGGSSGDEHTNSFRLGALAESPFRPFFPAKNAHHLALPRVGLGSLAKRVGHCVDTLHDSPILARYPFRLRDVTVQLDHRSFSCTCHRSTLGAGPVAPGHRPKAGYYAALVAAFAVPESSAPAAELVSRCGANCSRMRRVKSSRRSSAARCASARSRRDTSSSTPRVTLASRTDCSRASKLGVQVNTGRARRLREGIHHDLLDGGKVRRLSVHDRNPSEIF